MRRKKRGKEEKGEKKRKTWIDEVFFPTRNGKVYSMVFLKKKKKEKKKNC